MEEGDGVCTPDMQAEVEDERVLWKSAGWSASEMDNACAIICVYCGSRVRVSSVGLCL